MAAAGGGVGISGEIQDRQSQQVLLDQEQAVDDPARSAIAIREWVDGFKLVVTDGHADERVEVSGFVQEPFPVRKQRTQQVFVHGWV